MLGRFGCSGCIDRFGCSGCIDHFCSFGCIGCIGWSVMPAFSNICTSKFSCFPFSIFCVFNAVTLPAVEAPATAKWESNITVCPLSTAALAVSADVSPINYKFNCSRLITVYNCCFNSFYTVLISLTFFSIFILFW